MAYLTGVPGISGIDLYSDSATSYMGLGERYITGGRTFRYVKAGASNLVTGHVLQSPAVDTQFTNMTVPAAVAANTAPMTAITITNGTTTVVAGDFAGGSLSVYTTPALGEEYTIVANGAATNGAALTVYLDRPIRTAWSTLTKVNLRVNQWNGVLDAVRTTLTGIVVGVAMNAITALQYGWIQTGGVGAVIGDSTSILVGSAVVSPSTVGAGLVTLGTAGLTIVGKAMQATNNGSGIACFITLE